MQRGYLGHLLALIVTPANEQDRAQIGQLAAVPLDATGEQVQLASVDQGYTGEEPAEAATAHGLDLAVVQLPETEEARRGFVLLPRRWWSNAGSPGRRAAAALPGTTNGWRRCWSACISSPSLASRGVASLL